MKSFLTTHQALREERWQDLEQLRGASAQQENFLADDLTEGLKNVRLITRFEGSVLIPTLLTLWVRDGMYTYVWNQLVSKQPVSLCSKCGTPFPMTRSTRQFCSRRCEQATKQKRYREKLARTST